MKDKIIIATRESLLALWQAEHVKKRIEDTYPEIQVELLPVTTKGDQILDRSLLEIGGKGLFIKELEKLLLEKKADIAVHSLKDMTAVIPDGLKLAAVTAREDPRDAFVSLEYGSLQEFPAGAVVGTSSLRRQAQLLHLRPDLQIKTLRGNVQTRLRHLDEGNYDAVILAAAGLKRLGLQERIQSYISTCVMAIETRIGDDETMEIIQFIHDEKVASCIMAERAFLEKVGGDCKVPAGIYAVPFLGHIEAVAFIGSPDGKEMYKRSLNGQTQDAKQLGESLAEALIADGGGRILEELRK